MLGQKQCDHIAKLFVQHLAIYINENLLKSINKVLIILPNKNPKEF